MCLENKKMYSKFCNTYIFKKYNNSKMETNISGVDFTTNRESKCEKSKKVRQDVVRPSEKNDLRGDSVW